MLSRFWPLLVSSLTLVLTLGSKMSFISCFWPRMPSNLRLMRVRSHRLPQKPLHVSQTWIHPTSPYELQCRVVPEVRDHPYLLSRLASKPLQRWVPHLACILCTSKSWMQSRLCFICSPILARHSFVRSFGVFPNVRTRCTADCRRDTASTCCEQLEDVGLTLQLSSFHESILQHLQFSWRTDSTNKQGKSTAKAQSLQHIIFHLAANCASSTWSAFKHAFLSPFLVSQTQPSPYCCSPSMIGEVLKKKVSKLPAAQFRLNTSNEKRQIKATLHNSSSCRKPCKSGLHMQLTKEHNTKCFTLCSPSSPADCFSAHVTH